VDAGETKSNPEHFPEQIDIPTTDAKWLHLLMTISLVAEYDGKLIGFINGMAGTASLFPMFKKDAFVSVVNVYVCQEQRGTGLGRALVNEAMKWGMERGVERLRLEVTEATFKGSVPQD